MEADGGEANTGGGADSSCSCGEANSWWRLTAVVKLTTVVKLTAVVKLTVVEADGGGEANRGTYSWACVVGAPRSASVVHADLLRCSWR